MERDRGVAIDTAFNYASQYVAVHGDWMHYYEVGEGPPVVFLHGNPTWGYLWRNVVPHLAAYARCIVPDLIGMGHSAKPELAYRFFDHYPYVDGFIEALGLSGITLVGHDWGSALGLHYWDRNPEKVRGLALMEAIMGPLQWSRFPADFRLGFRLMRLPAIGWVIVSLGNGFVEQVLPRAVLRRLSDTEMAHYRAPFPTVASRRPVRQWPREIPLDGRPADVDAVVTDYARRLEVDDLPKLLLYGRPGGVIRSEQVAWFRANLPNLETVDVGPGIHFLQEDRPTSIGRALAAWFTRR